MCPVAGSLLSLILAAEDRTRIPILTRRVEMQVMPVVVDQEKSANWALPDLSRKVDQQRAHSGFGLIDVLSARRDLPDQFIKLFKDREPIFVGNQMGLVGETVGLVGNDPAALAPDSHDSLRG
jgi:hypothetical protein